MKKIFALVLCLFLVMTLFISCSSKKISENQETKTTTAQSETTMESETKNIGAENFTLAIAINDSLNPYTAKSMQNRQLSTLIYESLVVVDRNFEPVYQLAKIISGGKKEYVIILRLGAKFSNGNPVTSDDVVYSLNQAKNTSRYSGIFDNVQSVSSVNGDVKIMLKENDPNFANLLDFPIIPDESKDKRAKNGRIEAPLGSGKYAYQYDSLEPKLVSNEYYNGSEKPKIKTINLLNAPDNEAYEYLCKSNRISVCYTDYTGDNFPRIEGKSVSVNLNNFYFIGINHENIHLKNKEVRRAISFSIDRQDLCNKVFFENAVVCKGLFHPDYKAVDLKDTGFYTRQEKKAVEELKKIGYNTSGDGILKVQDVPLEINLLVNKESAFKVQAAENIAGKLRETGFKVTIEKTDMKTYKSKINNKDYDIYIGEIKIPNNADYSVVLNSKRVSANGVLADDVYQKFLLLRNGKTSAESFNQLFEEEMPLVSLVYRSGLMTYSNFVAGVATPVMNDIFFGMESWNYK